MGNRPIGHLYYEDHAVNDRFAERNPNDQLLGEIETKIIASQRHRLTLTPGSKVYFEPGHAGSGRHAIVVENSDGERLGHLPQRLFDWLYPLLTSGKIRLEGYLPLAAAESPQGNQRRCTIVLTVYQTDRGDFLVPISPRNEFEAVHEMIRQAYCSAQHYPKPEMILSVARRLAALHWEPMLPESRLLLALLPGLVGELHVCNSIGAIAEFSKALSTLKFGTPLRHDGLTFLPLLWAEQRNSSFVMLDQAAAHGEAMIEETSPAEGHDAAFAVVNRGGQPLLAPEGELICGQRHTGVVSTTVVVATGARLALELCSLGDWMSRRTRRHAAPEKTELRASSEPGRTPPKATSLMLDAAAAGVVASRGGRIIGIDLFASPGALRSVWAQLFEAYHLRAAQAVAAAEVTQDDAWRFIERIAGAAKARHPAFGIGCELEITAEDLVGRALLLDGALCHLCAFVPNDT